LVTALTDADFVPFSYFVDEVSLIVTFSPVGVVSLKPELETPLTLPVDPPAAGPERALDPPLPGACCAGVADVDDAVVAVGELVLAVALTMP
jgi:hypothetical protein